MSTLAVPDAFFHSILRGRDDGRGGGFVGTGWFLDGGRKRFAEGGECPGGGGSGGGGEVLINALRRGRRAKSLSAVHSSPAIRLAIAWCMIYVNVRAPQR